MWPPYLIRDRSRIAEMLAMPRLAEPQSRRHEHGHGRSANEQPYIHRLTRLGAAAAALGGGLPFLAEVSAVIFGGVRDWHLGNHLADAARRAGLDLAGLDRKSSTIQIATKLRSRKMSPPRNTPDTGECP